MRNRQPELAIHAAVIVTALLLALLQPSSGDLLSLHRTSVLDQHQWWRIITGHLVHLSWAHTLLNCGGLCLIIFTFILSNKNVNSEKNGPISALFLTSFYLLSALLIGAMLLLIDDNIHNYFGLSGVLYGLLALYIALDIKSYPIFSIFAMLALFAKVIWDQFHAMDDHMTAELIGGPVVASAHLYGGICGLVAAALIHARPSK